MQFSLDRPFPRPAGGYGYNQHLLTGKLASRACSVAALANVLVYEMEELLDSDAKNPEEWLLRLARLLRPKIYGVPTMRTFMRGARRAGARFGLSLEPFLYRGPFDAQSVARFIAEGLTANHPVLLLTWNHKESLFRYHWLTITAIATEGQDFRLTVSTWGRKREVLLSQYLSSKSRYRRLFYLVPVPMPRRD